MMAHTTSFRNTLILLWTIAAVLAVCPGQAQSQPFEVQPQGSTTGYAHCTNEYGQWVESCCLTVASGYYSTSAGHNHDANPGSHPYSGVVPSVGCYSDYESVPVTISATRIGQTEWVRVCAANGCDTQTLNVRYGNLQNYTGNANNMLIGQTAAHPSNHYGTPTLRTAIDAITNQYAAEYSCKPSYQPVGVNDMALQNGGGFDLNLDFYVVNPNGSHITHDRGNAVDFRAHAGMANSIIYDINVINRFRAICSQKGLGYNLFEMPGTSNEHVHCSTNGSGT